MPHDVKTLPGKKFHVHGTALLSIVRDNYPTATAEGSCGSYSFIVNGEIVAEAWMHRTLRDQWWLRIKEKLKENRK